MFLIYPASIPIEGSIHHKPAVIEFNTENAEPEFFNEPHLPKNVKYPVPKGMVQSAVNQNKYNELLRLLSLISNYYHFGYTSDQAWYIPISPERQGFQSAEWGQKMPPDIDKNEFDPKTRIEVNKKDSLEYYGDNLFNRITNEIIYPDTVEQLLDKYFELAESDKQILDKSIRLFCHGLELNAKIQSMAIVAFISSIENIVTFNHKDEPEDSCECGEIKYGVTRKFKKFVGKHIKAESNTKLKKYVDKIYDLRSKIVHSGGLHVGDLDRKMWVTPKLDEDTFLIQEIEQICRICLVNWIKNR